LDWLHAWMRSFAFKNGVIMFIASWRADSFGSLRLVCSALAAFIEFELVV
jgi:hypothetical protein